MANNLSTDLKIRVISALCEDCSIRGLERMTGVRRDTIMRLGVRMGGACKQILDQKMRGLDCRQIEVDEIWGFIHKKQKNAKISDLAAWRGDAWVFIALDAETKLIPSFLVGRRDAYHAKAFMSDLASRLKNRPQISSDALAAYVDAVERAFGSNADYGQIVKTFAIVNLAKNAASRYSPTEIVSTEKTAVSGCPNLDLICTSHVEKQNHTLRMHCRRLTRLTNAFSKKWENFEAAVALNFAYYDLCKIHLALRTTPAQAAGVESSQWSVAELVERCGE